MIGRIAARGPRTTCVDLVNVCFQYQSALYHFRQDMMHLNENQTFENTRDMDDDLDLHTSSKWNTRSNSHTFSNARSRDSTNTLFAIQREQPPHGTHTLADVPGTYLYEIQDP